MHRTTHAAAIFTALCASAASLLLALAPALLPRTADTALRVVAVPGVVASGPQAPRVVELERVVVHGKRDSTPAAVAAVAGTAAPLPTMLARGPD